MLTRMNIRLMQLEQRHRGAGCPDCPPKLQVIHLTEGEDEPPPMPDSCPACGRPTADALRVLISYDGEDGPFSLV